MNDSSDAGRLRALVRGVLALDPAAPAVEVGSRWRTWGEISDRMARLESLYAGLGLGEDARIAVMMRNRIDQYAALFSVLASDRCLVTLNPLYPPETLAEDIRNLKPPVVVAETADWSPEVRRAAAECGCAGIELTGDDAEPARLMAGLERVTDPRVQATNPGVIIEMLTSGTTGKPKRVALKRRSFEFAFAKTMAYESGRSPDDPPRLRASVQLLTSPLSHIGGIWHAVFQLTAGRKACLLEKFTVETWRDAVVRHRPRSASTPPAALRMILDAGIPKADLASLIILSSATAPLDWGLVDAVWERYGIPVLTNYGATEFSGAVAGWSLSDFKALRDEKRGSVGRLQAGIEARVVDLDTGDPVPLGQEGVLELRGRQLAAGPDEWLRTTDRAVLDGDDFLWIKGRVDNAIIRGGFKVHPDDVVKALEQHPAVREAAVVGVPDARLGEAPHAALLLKAGERAPSDAELTAFLRERLLPYQVPVRFHVLDELPRTASLKPALAALRERLSQLAAA